MKCITILLIIIIINKIVIDITVYNTYINIIAYKKICKYIIYFIIF